MAAKSLENNSIYQTLLKGLGDRDVEILAPGIDGYEENIKRWSEAAEKRAVCYILLLTNVSNSLRYTSGVCGIPEERAGCFYDFEGRERQ